jgi:hypothetical protein
MAERHDRKNDDFYREKLNLKERNTISDGRRN